MRRRVRAGGSSDPPLPLAHFRGTTNREAAAWIAQREAWWDQTHDEDDPGTFTFLFDGLAQVGDPHWCGSLGARCSNRDCLCHLEDEQNGETA